MKPTRVMLAAASTLLVSQVMAGEAVFYITEDGMSMRDVVVSVDGQNQLIGNTGFVSFDIDAGTHTVELSKYGEWMGEFQFTTQNGDQNAEIQVDVLGGEALEDVVVYTPGQEEAPALGQISGYLQSEETSGAVSGASVSIVGTEQAVVTDEDGFFSFELPRGEYEVSIAHPNYGQREVDGVRVMANVNTGVNLTLGMSGNGVIEEVVAVGSYIPSTATAQERDSSAVLDAIGSEQMARFGDSSAASALKRVAGVAVAGGQFAIIRGMAGRYISSTLNGSLMPSTDPMRRDVPLDLFPASVLGGIDIQKSFTPDLPGDSTGGAIRMNTKGMPEFTGGKASVKLGMNSRTTFSDVNSYEGGGSDWTGMDDGTREEPAAANAFLDADGGTPLFASQDDRRDLTNAFDHNYGVQQTQAKPAVGFSVSYGNLNEGDEYTSGHYGAISYSDETTARHDAKTSDVGESGTYERTKRNIDFSGYFYYGVEDMDNLWESKTILLRKTDDTIRTSYNFDDGLNQELKQTLLQWVERQYLGQQFSGTHWFGDDKLEWRAGIAQTSRYEPDRRSYTYGRATNSSRDYAFQGTVERRFSDLTEDVYNVGIDYTNEMMLDTWLLKNKLGVSYTTKSREVELTRYAGSPGGNANQPLDQIFSDANIDNYVVNFEGTTASTDSYNADEEIAAVYASSELDMNAVSVLAGLRYESLLQELEYPFNSGATNKLDESYILPALSANWRVTEDAQLRASVTQTISRPGITERSASVQYDPETDRPLTGNPNLEISDITNLDLRGEYYFSEEESVTVALFYKDVTKPIERGVLDADGNAAEGYTYANAPSAELTGLEADFRVNMFDTDIYSGFVSGNFAWVDSEVDLSGTDAERLEGDSSRALQGQSEYLANLQLGFDDYSTGQTLTFLVNYFDDRIYATSRGQLGAVIEDGRTTFDVVYSYDVTDMLKIKAKASNITDEPVSYSRDGRMLEEYFVGTDFDASVEYQF